MKKIVAKVILWILGLFAVVFFALPYIMTWLVNDSHEETWEAMQGVDLTCPSDSEVTVRGWSKAGYSRYCEPKKNGPWEAWAGGYLQVRGEYQNGLKHGKWQWFKRDGSVQSEISYRGGEAIGE